MSDKIIIRNACLQPGEDCKNILISNGFIEKIGDNIPSSGALEIDLGGAFVCHAFTDVHVHFREPGRPDKETVRTGSMAAARGGCSCVCTMPNISPVPDSPSTIAEELSIILSDAVIDVLPYASITAGRKGQEPVDFKALKEYCVAFSDDGSGIQDEAVMLDAMTKAATLGCIITAHCEDNSLLQGGYIHDGEYAREHGHRGICSESEWGQIKRDAALAAQAGCKYHVCHISTAESVDVIRKAKAAGTDITCETAPHYLILSENDLQEDGRFKMNPPLRSERDRAALIEGLKDGTIDMIATDHAPHTAEEKARGLEKSAFGIVGIETAFPLLYTYLVKKGIITLDRLVELMAEAPRRRFGLGGGVLEEGCRADITAFDLEDKYVIDPSEFLSKGRSTPFEGVEVYGRCLLTLCNGKIVWKYRNI